MYENNIRPVMAQGGERWSRPEQSPPDNKDLHRVLSQQPVSNGRLNTNSPIDLAQCQQLFPATTAQCTQGSPGDR